MRSASGSLFGAAQVAELTESEASLRVFLTAGGLAILGLALMLFTIWWWRSTRPEPPALGPLEVMSDRRWYSASDGERRRLIDETRPRGSALAAHAAPVPIDLSVLSRGDATNFDDLREVEQPVEDVPVGDVPVGDVPVEDVPVEGAPVEDAPVEDVPVEDETSTEAAEQQLELEVDDVRAEPESDPTESETVAVHDQFAGDDRAADGDRAADATMHQVELPDTPSLFDDEAAIDPLLQRTASQE